MRQLADYVSLVNRLQTDLNGLAAVGTQATTLPQSLDRLQARLTQLTARVNALATQGQISSAQATTLRQRIANLSTRVAALRPTAEQAARLDAQVRQAQSQMPPLNDGAVAAKRLQPQVNTQLAEARRLAVQAGIPPTVREPEGLEDVRGELPTQPEERVEPCLTPREPQVSEQSPEEPADSFMPLPPPIGAGNGYPVRRAGQHPPDHRPSHQHAVRCQPAAARRDRYRARLAGHSLSLPDRRQRRQLLDAAARVDPTPDERRDGEPDGSGCGASRQFLPNRAK